MSGERYEAREESMLGHGCCFDCTVVDTSQMDGGRNPKIICECFDMETGQLIADALNCFSVTRVLPRE